MERYAIYYVPDQADPLYQLARDWFEHDSYREDISAIHLDHNDLLNPLQPYADFNQGARKYGFHATLKPPFRLKSGASRKQLHKMIKQFSKLNRPFECEALKIARIGDFLAIVPRSSCDRLNQLAQDCVQTFDVFRAPLNEQELEKRRPDSLSPRQRELLDQWGYPYVLDEFRFHMTLTDKLNGEQLERCQPVLDNYFQPYLSRTLRIDRICLCYQQTPAQPFEILESYEFKRKR
jgi:putative phosphonate metabolism protein